MGQYPFELFVFDLDGTALGGYDPYDRLPDPFSAFLDGLDAAGVRWCTNTTWAPELQAEMILRSAVRSRPAFLSGATGMMRARWDRATDRPVPDDAWAAAAEQTWREFTGAFLPDLAGWWASRFGSELPWRVPDCFVIQVRVAPERRDAILRVLSPFLDGDGRAYASADAGVESLLILPRMMCKGYALRAMQQALGVTPARTLVAGDGENDVSMFDRDLARFQVCPANACDAVRERVRANGGALGEASCSDGVREAVLRVLSR